MKRNNLSLILRGVGVATGLALLCTAVPSFANDTAMAVPAAVAPADNTAKASFTKFARSWMDKVQATASDQKPTVQPGAANATMTYRDYGDDFTVELRPTGHASAPYVGILRYSEQIFSCAKMAGENCTMSSSIPVTEIFRYQGGRWVY
jgi:hypothetical protein